MEWEAVLTGVYEDGREESLGSVVASTQDQVFKAAEEAAVAVSSDPDSGPGLSYVIIHHHAVVRLSALV